MANGNKIAAVRNVPGVTVFYRVGSQIQVFTKNVDSSSSFTRGTALSATSISSGSEIAAARVSPHTNLNLIQVRAHRFTFWTASSGLPERPTNRPGFFTNAATIIWQRLASVTTEQSQNPRFRLLKAPFRRRRLPRPSSKTQTATKSSLCSIKAQIK